MIDFLIIGGTKCGSTSLADYVSASNKVNFCYDKEPGVLNKPQYDGQVIEAYNSLFENKSGLKGEATPAYSDLNQVDKVISNIKSIQTTSPKIILSVRNQVKRIESSHLQAIKAGKFDSDKVSEISLERPGTISRGMFGQVIEKYIDAFSEENILVLSFDELIKPNSTEIEKLKKFLGLEDYLPGSLPKSNPSIGAPKKNLVSRVYKKHISRYWRKLNLPSLRSAAGVVDRFSVKIKESEALKLTDEQISLIKNLYENDSRIFESIVGWNYWDLKK